MGKNKVLLSVEEFPAAGVKSKADKCVLIYEDNLEILFLCKMLLTRDQYRVETRTRCDNVIDDIALIKPDLILMDLWIPEIGGEKAVVLIKENPATQHVPVLLFSANDKIEEICKKTNANGYIAKPFDVHTFNETIARNI
ncbi:response regulator [Cryomorpha ignava]|uniref:Response regulator n=1 Tax=Cryomorpha ignava TaxID=101383 RepID=A0A7K3WU75_9FLAO|nr:response regulator [Cryomorpha ignava]NEN24215.1 response regulator [Cryomorpha ignava]